jgi:hypothetical protein
MPFVPEQPASVKPLCSVCLGPQRITVIEAPWVDQAYAPFDLSVRSTAIIHCLEDPSHDLAGGILAEVVAKRERMNPEAWQTNDARPKDWL